MQWKQRASARGGWRCALASCLVAWCAVACGDVSQEAARVELPVVVDGSGLSGSVSTDLGYDVEVTALRVAMERLEFTTEGETHLAALRSLERLLLPVAHAHPGHYAGGEIIGELPGRYVLDLIGGDGAELGAATLLEGDYNGANFTFVRATAEDGLSADDPLIGHTMLLEGVARRGEEAIAFSALIDQDEDRQVVGAPLELDLVEGATVRLGVQALVKDPFSADTAFDGIDFGALDGDGDGQVRFVSGDPDANRLRRALQTHTYYFVAVLP